MVAKISLWQSFFFIPIAKNDAGWRVYLHMNLENIFLISVYK